MRAWDFDSGDVLEALDTLDAEDPPFERLFTKGNRYTITKTYPLRDQPVITVINDSGQNNFGSSRNSVGKCA